MKISIPDPCSVPLADMQPVKGGFYCDSCAKKVTDFRDWSETDIQSYFKKQAGSKSCGIFRNTQIQETKSVIIVPKVNDFQLTFRQQFLYALLICFSTLFFSCGQDNAAGKIDIQHPYFDTSAYENNDVVNDSLSTITADSSIIIEESNLVGFTVFEPEISVGIIDDVTAGAPYVEYEEIPIPQEATTKGETNLNCTKEMKDENGKPITPFVGVSIEQMPEFPGGEFAMHKFLRKNIVYPKYEKDHDIQGKVYAKFLVEEDGSITNVSIFRGVEGSLYFDAEVIRVIQLMPKWKPGKRSGKAQDVWFTLPIDFSLE